MPTGGWKNGTLLQLIVLCGIAVILLLVVLTISIPVSYTHLTLPTTPYV